MHYPTTLAPLYGPETVNTECADNAAGSSLSVQCEANGYWSGDTPECYCNDGYHAETVEGRQICRGTGKFWVTSHL